MTTGTSVGRVIGERQQVGGSLTGSIRASRPQRVALDGLTLGDLAVNLVGRNLDETRDPAPAHGFEEDLRAQGVGAQEGLGIVDRAVDVGLGGEVYDRIGLGADRLVHGRRIADVAPQKAVTRRLLEIGEVRRVSGVGHGVEVDDLEARALVQRKANEVRADKAQTPRNHPAHAAAAFGSRSQGAWPWSGWAAGAPCYNRAAVPYFTPQGGGVFMTPSRSASAGWAAGGSQKG